MGRAAFTVLEKRHPRAPLPEAESSFQISVDLKKTIKEDR
jgi:hypothetical protein